MPLALRRAVRIARAAVPALGIVVSAACGHRQTGGPGSQEARSEIQMLVSALRAQVGARVTPPDSSNIGVASSRSSVVRSLTYRWATYRPANATDAAWHAVIASNGAQAFLLRGPADWSRAAGSWRPSTAAEAIAACGEAISVAGPHANPINPPVLYRAGLALGSLAVRDTAKIGALPPAEARRDLTTGAWRVAGWAIEPGRLARYECLFPESAAMQLRLLDSVPGFGLAPLGP